jgi:hypothetical protein
MKRIKEVRIDDRIIKVNELTVKQLIELGRRFTDRGPDADTSTKAFIDEIRGSLSMVVEGITFEELESLAPSEITQLYDAFKEVNSAFLTIAEKMGFGNTIRELLRGMRNDFSGYLPNSSKQDTSTQSTTDTPSS